MCVHSHSSVNLRKYHVNYLHAAVKDENTMTMATAMKNAIDTTLATFSASRVVLNALETFKLQACMFFLFVNNLISK